MIYIEAINIGARVVVTEDGSIFPMEAFFDADGDECAPEDAAQIICGKGDCWFNVHPAEYESSTTH